MNVFLSYASGDRQVVARLASDLSHHRLSVWWDVNRANPGSSIDDAVTNGIATSDWFLAVMSPEAVASAWVLKEVRLACDTNARAGKPGLVPVLLDSCALPEGLRHRAHADFRYDYQDGFDSLLRAIGSPYRRALLDELLSESESSIGAAWAMSEDQHSWCISRLEGFLTAAGSADAAPAITALAQIAPDRLRPHLGRLLSADSTAIVRRALSAVGALRERTLTQLVLGLASHGNPAIRQAAREAMRRLQPGPPNRRGTY